MKLRRGAAIFVRSVFDGAISMRTSSLLAIGSALLATTAGAQIDVPLGTTCTRMAVNSAPSTTTVTGPPPPEDGT